MRWSPAARRGAGARIRRWSTAVLSTAAAAAALAPVAPGAYAAVSVEPQTFGVGSHTYTVPPAVTRLLVEAAGAQGGSDGSIPGAQTGLGARVVSVMLVTPGEQLTILVGGRPTGLYAGGFNGGGAGGSFDAYGGGGATDIRRGPLLTSRVVVAGGGGGHGGGAGGGAGGNGGAPATAGMPVHPTSTGAGAGSLGGGPGTAAAGGAGGLSTSCVQCGPSDGAPGAFGEGGRGGSRVSGGGGGGGGYYGGGGGAAGWSWDAGGGGGGGGASYVSPIGAIPVAMDSGTQAGDGYVVLTPDPVADQPPQVTLVSPEAGAAFPVGATPVFTVRADDPDGDLRWVGRIEIRNSAGPVAALFTNPAASGESASASPPAPLPPGSYEWRAAAVDSGGGSSEYSEARAFTVSSGNRPAATGGIGFHGQAHLPAFPCSPPPPFGTGPCDGSFTGAWTGQLAGLADDDAFEATWTTAPGRLQAAFEYVEWQCLAGVETVLGFAVGSGTAVAEPGEVHGKLHVAGEAFPRDIVRVTASFDFEWVRVGASAVLVLEPVSLALEVAGLGTREVVTQPQAGAAAFVATSANVTSVPTCGEPLTNVQGEIAGTVPLVEAAASGG